MALNIKITKEVYDALPEDVKKEYKVTAEGYQLDLNGYEDPAELKRAKDREKERANDEKKRADTAEAKIADLEKNTNVGDIDKLDKRWQGKYDKDTTDLKAQIKSRDDKAADTSRKSTAEALANKLSKSPALLLPHVLDRLVAEIADDGTVSLKMKDKDGKLVDYKSDDFEKSFRDNKDFGAIIQASGASGGGAPVVKPGAPGGAGPTPPRLPFGGVAPNGDAPLDIAKADPRSVAAMVKERIDAKNNAAG